MGKIDNMTFNINGGQLNISKDNSILIATQNNGASVNELNDIIKEIMESVRNLDRENAEKIIEAVKLAEEELKESEPRQSKLRTCLASLTPMITIVNGIPDLLDNLLKMQKYIMQYVK